MKQAFVKKRFSASSLELIETADAICNEYMSDDLTLTLRQLYYQFVARDIITNNLKSYKRLASIVNDARLAGLIDWDAIEDRTRGLKRQSAWTEPQDIIRSAWKSYQRNLWSTQRNHVEVWVEKDALIGVIERACEKYRVPFLSCRGYTSQSELYTASRRAMSTRDCHVIYLGDHDPSGLDMTRDISERFDMFGASVKVHRVALNIEQVEEYSPPPNIAKLTDSRCSGYVERFGDESWELDALEPKTLCRIIEGKIDSLVDSDAWEEGLSFENEEKRVLQKIYANYGDVAEFLKCID